MIKIGTLIELITELVEESGRTWKEKRDGVLAVISDEELTSLEEFCSWFERGQRDEF